MPKSIELLTQVSQYVEKYMHHENGFDSSHNFQHIKRVVGLAHTIYFEIMETSPSSGLPAGASSALDISIITLAALLHDIGDRKYLKQGQNGETMVYQLLLDFGADEELASKIQIICNGVSFNSEVKNLPNVQSLILQYPELAVVQDADRLDSIGAIGVGRVFTYGGAKEATRGMDGSMKMMDYKLYKLESMMKTEPGKRIAREKTARMRVFHSWWDEEVQIEKRGAMALADAVNISRET